MPSFHYNVATEGVRAGHKFLAVLGFKKLFGVEIIITPDPAEHGAYADSFLKTDPKQVSGGGMIIQPWQDYVPELAKYHITIIVTRGDKKWRLDKIVEHRHFNPIRILVNFIKTKQYRTAVSAKFIKMLNKYISIFARKKD